MFDDPILRERREPRARKDGAEDEMNFEKDREGLARAYEEDRGFRSNDKAAGEAKEKAEIDELMQGLFAELNQMS